MNRQKCTAVVFVLALAAMGVEGQQLNRRTPPQPVRQFLKAGNWQSYRDAAGQRDWQVQLKRFDDDSLTGRLTIIGSARIRQAKIIGQISGSEVYGVIVGDTDVQLGTFSGTIGSGGMSGTYTTADGDTGEWSSSQSGH